MFAQKLNRTKTFRTMEPRVRRLSMPTASVLRATISNGAFEADFDVDLAENICARDDIRAISAEIVKPAGVVQILRTPRLNIGVSGEIEFYGENDVRIIPVSGTRVSEWRQIILPPVRFPTVVPIRAPERERSDIRTPSRWKIPVKSERSFRVQAAFAVTDAILTPTI